MMPCRKFRRILDAARPSMKSVGADRTQLRLVMLRHVEAELTHVGARAVRVDADQVRLGPAELAAFIAEDLRGPLARPAATAACKSPASACHHLDVPRVRKGPRQPAGVRTVVPLRIRLLDQDLALVA